MYKRRLITAIALISYLSGQAQVVENRNNISNLAVPFLLLSSDAFSAGIGDAGSAMLSDGQDIESGISKLALAQKKFSVSSSYTPWLRKLANDRKLIYAGGFYKPQENIAISISINYLSYGMIDFIDDSNVALNSVKPAEFYFGAGVAKRFGDNFSLGIKTKVIHSNMYNGASNNLALQSGTSYGIDLSAIQILPLLKLPGSSSLSFALNISNIGPKISYFNQSSERFYLPTNLKLGSTLKVDDHNDNILSFSFDLSKLLVNSKKYGAEESVGSALFSSFANGNTFEDLWFSTGLDYSLKKRVAFRIGYNYQKNQRLLGSFFSIGTGLTHKNVSINLAYLIADPQVSFLSDTMRFSLNYSLF